MWRGQEKQTENRGPGLLPACALPATSKPCREGLEGLEDVGTKVFLGSWVRKRANAHSVCLEPSFLTRQTAFPRAVCGESETTESSGHARPSWSWDGP